MRNKSSIPWRACAWTVLLASTTALWAQSDVTQPGDVVFASSANSPPSEGVANAIDNKTTKYLNFDSGRDGNQIGTFSPSGLAVTPSVGLTHITGISLQSANDDDRRDPDVILIEGSNGAVTNYADGAWEEIATISNAAIEFTNRFQTHTFTSRTKSLTSRIASPLRVCAILRTVAVCRSRRWNCWAQ